MKAGTRESGVPARTYSATSDTGTLTRESSGHRQDAVASVALSFSGSGLHLIYGGTFDPVHNGHLAIARAARDAFGVAVRMMPAADPPHRPAPGADVQQRCAMLALAIADESELLLDLREVRRASAQPGVASYSIDTVRELRAELGVDAPLALLIGADSLVGFTGWREWRALLDTVHLIVADRPGSGWQQALPEALTQALAGRWAASPQALAAAAGGLLWCLGQPLRTESSSQVRGRIAAGGDWQGLLPAAVADYIRAHRVYAEDASTAD